MGNAGGMMQVRQLGGQPERDTVPDNNVIAVNLYYQYLERSVSRRR